MSHVAHTKVRGDMAGTNVERALELSRLTEQHSHDMKVSDTQQHTATHCNTLQHTAK